jgi:hypothetical protein
MNNGRDKISIMRMLVRSNEEEGLRSGKPICGNNINEPVFKGDTRG